MSTLACGLADLLLRNLDTDADRLLLRIDDHRLTPVSAPGGPGASPRG